MSKIGWIDALRRWNAGSPSWCIPRKGTPAYESIMRIRRGEPEKTVRERVQELEAKSPAQKKERKTMTINISKTNEKEDKPKKVMELTRFEKNYPKQLAESKKAQEYLDKHPSIKKLLDGYMLMFVKPTSTSGNSYLARVKRQEDGDYLVETLLTKKDTLSRILENDKMERFISKAGLEGSPSKLYSPTTKKELKKAITKAQQYDHIVTLIKPNED